MPTGSSTGVTVAEIGARIRTLRRRAGLTLVQLGGRTGLSHPFLSQLERGRCDPSLESLTRIADALGIPTGSLTADPDAAPATVTRRRDAVRFAKEGSRARVLGDGRRMLLPIEITVRSARWSVARRFPAEVGLYVVSGRVETEVDTDRYAMGPGDALVFDAGTPSRYRSAEAGLTSVLFAILLGGVGTPEIDVLRSAARAHPSTA